MTNKTWQKWTQEEDEKLKIYWLNSSMVELLEAFPTRGYNSLMCRAQKLGIKTQGHRNRVNGDLSILLEKTPMSFYLLGFIIADGCFTSKDDIVISQSAKEKSFFYKLIEMMNGDTTKIKHRTIKCNSYTKIPYESVHFRVGHKKILNELKDRLKLIPSKTYNPLLNIEYFFEEDIFAYFLIGLIDGDGCIWMPGSPQIRVEMHSSWLPILEKIKEYANKTFNIKLNTKMTTKGFAQLWFGSIHSTFWLYKLAKSSFHMERKWSKLDDYFMKKYIPKYIKDNL